jgi:hypothetical protein
MGIIKITETKFNFGTVYYPFEGYYKIKYAPSNREQKRKFIRETDKIIKELFTIENEFLWYMFGPEDDEMNMQYYGLEHMEVYEHFCKRYEAMCDWLNRTQKFVYIEIKRDYFREEYRKI